MLDIINALKAESLIAGSWVLEEVQRTARSLEYQEGEQTYTYEGFYRELLSEVDRMQSIQLQPIVTPGTSRAYLIDLTTALETVLDQIESTTNRVLFFQSKVRSAKVNLDNLSNTFKAWYLVALQQELKRFEIKLPSKALDSLSESEFQRLVGDSATVLDALDGALALLSDRLKARKKLATEKYNLGKDQANMSLLPQLGPQQGYEDDKMPGVRLLKEKYGLGENRSNLVLDDPPPEMFKKRRRVEDRDEPVQAFVPRERFKADQAEATHTELDCKVATKASLTKVVMSEPAVDLPWVEDQVVNLDPNESGIPTPDVDFSAKAEPVIESSVTSNDDVFTQAPVKKAPQSALVRRKVADEESEPAQPVPEVLVTKEKPTPQASKRRRIVFDDDEG